MFEKGKTSKSPGRPKGSKDKSYLKLEYWYNELMKDWPKLRPAQRAKLSKELMQMLTNKMKALPGTPEQSVLNAKEAQQMLEGLEDKKDQTNTSDLSLSPSTPLPPKSEGCTEL